MNSYIEYIRECIGDDYFEILGIDVDNIPYYEAIEQVIERFKEDYPEYAAEYIEKKEENDKGYTRIAIVRKINTELTDEEISKIYTDYMYNRHSYRISGVIYTATAKNKMTIVYNQVRYKYSTMDRFIEYLKENPNGSISGYNNKALYNFIVYIVRHISLQYYIQHNKVIEYNGKYYMG